MKLENLRLIVFWKRSRQSYIHKIMSSVFGVLVDYVEVEKAKLYVLTTPGMMHAVPWWKRTLGIWRNPDFGLARLELEKSFVLQNGQKSVTAIGAEIVSDLYWWWKTEGHAFDFSDEATVEQAELVTKMQESLNKLVTVLPNLCLQELKNAR